MCLVPVGCWLATRLPRRRPETALVTRIEDMIVQDRPAIERGIMVAPAQLAGLPQETLR
jgi:hypothetical protein